MSNLETKAMIVNLTASAWSAAKTDKGLSLELTSMHDASEGAAKVRKQLLSKDAVKPLRLAIDGAKAVHSAMTLPWSDHGERLLPVAMHDEYREKMAACIGKIDEARREFVERYSDEVEQARIDLGTMFRENDYPAPATIGRKFGVSYEISPVPSAKHFVADIGAAEAQRIKADLERRMQAKLDAAVVRLYERVEEGLRRLIERLGVDEAGNPRRIHESALEAVRGLADAVPSLNLTQDPRLNEISAKIKSIVDNLDVTEFRMRGKGKNETDAVLARRKDVQTELNAIAAAYFGG